MRSPLSAGVQVAVSVPATSANLGPGFDCFALALDWREQVELAVTSGGYQIEVTGEGADELPRDESHLIISSTLTGLADLGVAVPGLRLRCHNTIPHGRGLGSSAAAIVAGLLAARALTGAGEDAGWLLRHATAIEGHPDNVAAAIYGGFVLAFDAAIGLRVAQGELADDLAAAIFVPQRSVATRAARELLPRKVPHVEAAANAARAGLLVHALGHDLDLLLEATRDWLHQSYRQPMMPESYELLKELRGDGFAAVISGAGPAVLVLGRQSELAELSERPVPGFAVHRAAVGPGARTDVA